MKTLRRVAAALAPRVVAAGESLLEPGGGYGVVAVGVDAKWRDGRSLGYSTLVAYVERKHPLPARPIPAVEVELSGVPYRIEPDVVAVGTPRIQSGGEPLWTGLHAGGCIEVRYGGGGTERGAVAVIAGGTRPTHAVTAGHLFAPHLVGMPVYASPSPHVAPFVIGRLSANLLDAAEGAIDAAAVELLPAGVQLARATQRGPQLAAVLPTSIAGGRRAQAFLATRHAYSAPLVNVRRTSYTAVLWAPRRSTYIRLRDPVRSEHAITIAGDSGTILMTCESSRRGIGLCSGSYDGESLFEPLELALTRLSARLSTPLRLWKRQT